MTFWSDKKILITGGAGFFGSQVVNQLLENGVLKENIRIPRSREIDLRKWDNCAKVVKDCDIVIHLAAKVGGIGFNQNYPGSLFYDNAIMGIQMIEAARQEWCRKMCCCWNDLCLSKIYSSTLQGRESLEWISRGNKRTLWFSQKNAACPVTSIPAGIWI